MEIERNIGKSISDQFNDINDNNDNKSVYLLLLWF